MPRSASKRTVKNKRLIHDIHPMIIQQKQNGISTVKKQSPFQAVRPCEKETVFAEAVLFTLDIVENISDLLSEVF